MKSASIAPSSVERIALESFWHKRLRHLAPHIGSISLSQRLMRPESYRQALAEVRDFPKWRRIRSCLDDYTQRHGDFFFVQIGANDGVAGDPIREHVIKHKWRGLLVEPVPHIFNQLRSNYAEQHGLDFANVAVSNRNGTSTMLAGVKLPDGEHNPLSSISSLHPHVVEKHQWLANGRDNLVESLEVPTVTLPTLLEAYGVEDIDGLFIDTEGHDKVILDQLEGIPRKPHFILYEHNHISTEETGEIRDMLTGMGYQLTTMRRDMFAEARS